MRTQDQNQHQPLLIEETYANYKSTHIDSSILLQNHCSSDTATVNINHPQEKELFHNIGLIKLISKFASDFKIVLAMSEVNRDFLDAVFDEYSKRLLAKLFAKTPKDKTTIFFSKQRGVFFDFPFRIYAADYVARAVQFPSYNDLFALNNSEDNNHCIEDWCEPKPGEHTSKYYKLIYGTIMDKDDEAVFINDFYRKNQRNFFLVEALLLITMALTLAYLKNSSYQATSENLVSFLPSLSFHCFKSQWNKCSDEDFSITTGLSLTCDQASKISNNIWNWGNFSNFSSWYNNVDSEWDYSCKTNKCCSMCQNTEKTSPPLPALPMYMILLANSTCSVVAPACNKLSNIFNQVSGINQKSQEYGSIFNNLGRSHGSVTTDVKWSCDEVVSSWEKCLGVYSIIIAPILLAGSILSFFWLQCCRQQSESNHSLSISKQEIPDFVITRIQGLFSQPPTKDYRIETTTKPEMN